MRRILLLAATAALLIPAAANAGAVISNGTIGLGVDNAGQLNIGSSIVSAGRGGGAGGTTNYGLRDIATNREATAQGCLCEGWGAAVAGTGRTLFANNALGSSSDIVTSFSSTATTANSVAIGSGSGSGLSVTHAFHPSATPLLYQVDVTITNTSGADFAGATLYRRTMDWDIEPTAFSEFSTIQGVAGATNVLKATDNGFCNSNALTACNQLVAGGTGDFIDLGPTDHGANFDFSFAALAAGASQKLTIFYGAAPTEAAALGALGAVGAEVYSFGQASTDMTGGAATTFIFGFKGVGGAALPGGVPEPTSWALMIMGFGFAGAAIRRRRMQTAA